MLKAEAMLQEEDNSRQPRRDQDCPGASQVGGNYSQLECVASGGRFVIFVALQGKGRNANVEVGAVGPFDAKRPPEQK